MVMGVIPVSTAHVVWQDVIHKITTGTATLKAAGYIITRGHAGNMQTMGMQITDVGVLKDIVLGVLFLIGQYITELQNVFIPRRHVDAWSRYGITTAFLPINPRVYIRTAYNQVGFGNFHSAGPVLIGSTSVDNTPLKYFRVGNFRSCLTLCGESGIRQQKKR